MGGFGSGRPRVKSPVEDCLALLIADLKDGALLRPGFRTSGTLSWKCNRAGQISASVIYELSALRDSEWLRLRYVRKPSGETIDYRVALRAVRSPWGGPRWAFICPATNCGRVCRGLYLPLGGRHFLCRICHRLTYQSSQEAHSLERLLASLGFAPRDVRGMLSTYPRRRSNRYELVKQ